MESELPHDMLIEIFSRLPAKSVGRCRCLAKEWGSLLSTPHFIKSHLNRRHHQENLILVTPSYTIRSVSNTGDYNISKRLELGDNWFKFEGSCDGLVLLTNYKAELFLLNPTTQEQVKIPESPLALKWNEGCRMYGFGYDSTIDDYKVVMLSYYIPDEELDGDTFVDVYYVKRGVWKRVGLSPYNHVLPEDHSGAFVNGALHWLAGAKDPDQPSVVAAFDLASEEFFEMHPPVGVNAEMFVFFDVVALGGYLCVVDPRSSIGTDVWFMSKYGLADSWMLHSIDEDMAMPFRFSGNIYDGEMLVASEMDSLLVLDLKAGEWRIMEVDGVPALGVVRFGATFVETLVSPAPSFDPGDDVDA